MCHAASAAPRLLQLLRTTESPIIRNAAALALSDLNEPQAFQVLVDLLRDERTQNNRGTLLYALGAYDCSSILPLLVERFDFEFFFAFGNVLVDCCQRGRRWGWSG